MALPSIPETEEPPPDIDEDMQVVEETQYSANDEPQDGVPIASHFHDLSHSPRGSAFPTDYGCGVEDPPRSRDDKSLTPEDSRVLESTKASRRPIQDQDELLNLTVKPRPKSSGHDLARDYKYSPGGRRVNSSISTNASPRVGDKETPPKVHSGLRTRGQDRRLGGLPAQDHRSISPDVGIDQISGQVHAENAGSPGLRGVSPSVVHAGLSTSRIGDFEIVGETHQGDLQSPVAAPHPEQNEAPLDQGGYGTVRPEEEMPDISFQPLSDPVPGSIHGPIELAVRKDAGDSNQELPTLIPSAQRYRPPAGTMGIPLSRESKSSFNKCVREEVPSVSQHVPPSRGGNAFGAGQIQHSHADHGRLGEVESEDTIAKETRQRNGNRRVPNLEKTPATDGYYGHVPGVLAARLPVAGDSGTFTENVLAMPEFSVDMPAPTPRENHAGETRRSARKGKPKHQQKGAKQPDSEGIARFLSHLITREKTGKEEEFAQLQTQYQEELKYLQTTVDRLRQDLDDVSKWKDNHLVICEDNNAKYNALQHKLVVISKSRDELLAKTEEDNAKLKALSEKALKHRNYLKGLNNDLQREREANKNFQADLLGLGEHNAALAQQWNDLRSQLLGALEHLAAVKEKHAKDFEMMMSKLGLASTQNSDLSRELETKSRAIVDEQFHRQRLEQQLHSHTVEQERLGDISTGNHRAIIQILADLKARLYIFEDVAKTSQTETLAALIEGLKNRDVSVPVSLEEVEGLVDAFGASMGQRLEGMKAQDASISGQIEQIQAQLVAFKNDATQIQSLQEQTSVLQVEKATLTERHRAAQELVTRLSRQVDELKTEARKSDERCTLLTNQLHRSAAPPEADFAQLKTELADMTRQVKERESCGAGLQAEVAKLKENLTAREEELLQANALLARSSNETDAKLEALRQEFVKDAARLRKDQLAQFENQLDDSNLKIRKLEAELNQLKANRDPRRNRASKPDTDSLKRQHEAEVASLKDEHSRQTQRADQESQGRLQKLGLELEERYASERRALQLQLTESNTARDQTEADLQLMRSTVDAQIRKACEQISREHMKELQKLREAHNVEQLSVHDRAKKAEAELEDLRNAAENQLSSNRTTDPTPTSHWFSHTTSVKKNLRAVDRGAAAVTPEPAHSDHSEIENRPPSRRLEHIFDFQQPLATPKQARPHHLNDNGTREQSSDFSLRFSSPTGLIRELQSDQLHNIAPHHLGIMSKEVQRANSSQRMATASSIRSLGSERNNSRHSNFHDLFDDQNTIAPSGPVEIDYPLGELQVLNTQEQQSQHQHAGPQMSTQAVISETQSQDVSQWRSGEMLPPSNAASTNAAPWTRLGTHNPPPKVTYSRRGEMMDKPSRRGSLTDHGQASQLTAPNSLKRRSSTLSHASSSAKRGRINLSGRSGPGLVSHEKKLPNAFEQHNMIHSNQSPSTARRSSRDNGSSRDILPKRTPTRIQPERGSKKDQHYQNM